MNKNRMVIKRSLVIGQLILIGLTGPVFAQQEKQQEYVQVVNVELILRVLKDGSPVGGLVKKDFALYEDGEKCEINGFFENRRRMARTPAAAAHPQPSRLYLLFFWIANPAADVEGVLHKFFSDIYHEGDRVILSTLLKTFDLSSRQDGDRILSAFLEQWRKEARDDRLKKIQVHEQLNRMCEDLISRLAADIRQGQRINAFIKQYQGAVLEYQLRELTPDLTNFQAMADSLVPIKNDKFALVFFQHDVLPLLDIVQFRSQCAANGITEEVVNSLAAELDTVEIQSKMFFNTQRFSEKLKTLFIQADTQFHLLFLSPDRNDMRANVSSAVPFTKSEEVFSNWDRVLREISKNTGGLILDGDRMVSALEQVVEFEDVYYHLTYVPRGRGEKKRKIDIRVDRPGMQVLYGRTLELKELPQVKIMDITASNNLIRLGVADFYPIAKDGVPTGLVNVCVTGRWAEKTPPRLLVSRSAEVNGSIELPLAFPEPGAWELEVRVTDEISGHQDQKKVRLEITPAVPIPWLDSERDPQLITLLRRAAVNAENLKKAAFHFVCREEVVEEMFSQSGIRNRPSFSKRNYWIYDYQIIGQDGKITENRLLFEKNRNKLHLDKSQLETGFRSFYSFYMPVTIFASEKQHHYHYRLLDKKKVQKKQVWHIAVVRRNPAMDIPWGEAWISEEDGAILKIQIEQTSIAGFEALAQKAREKGLEPQITTIHEYGVEKARIRFPSRTTFIERYKSNLVPVNKWGNQNQTITALEPGFTFFIRSQTYFEYKDYRFFSVVTNVEEKTE